MGAVTRFRKYGLYRYQHGENLITTRLFECSCFWHIASSGSEVEFILIYLILFFDKPTRNVQCSTVYPFHIASLLHGNDAVPFGSIASAYVMAILLDNQVDRPYLTTTHTTTTKFNTNTKSGTPRILGHVVAAVATLCFLFTVNSRL